MHEGYRGYIVSAPVRGSHFPQRVQNLVVRDYAQRRGLAYRLSMTEYAMPGSTMMLASLLDELDAVEGIILFSLFTLPRDRARRRAIYERVLGAGKVLHAALEQLALRTPADAAEWDDLIEIDATLPLAPFGGRYEKDALPLGPDAGAALAAFGLRPEAPDA
jgi:sporadic carbohydrate cluster protein (TIGR04323 family)